MYVCMRIYIYIYMYIYLLLRASKDDAVLLHSPPNRLWLDGLIWPDTMRNNTFWICFHERQQHYEDPTCPDSTPTCTRQTNDELDPVPTAFSTPPALPRSSCKWRRRERQLQLQHADALGGTERVKVRTHGAYSLFHQLYEESKEIPTCHEFCEIHTVQPAWRPNLGLLACSAAIDWIAVAELQTQIIQKHPDETDHGSEGHISVLKPHGSGDNVIIIVIIINITIIIRYEYIAVSLPIYINIVL